MSELVADCPRCGSHQITFDLKEENLTDTKYGWQQIYEAFCVCRRCKKATIFVLSQNGQGAKELVQRNGLSKQTVAINRLMNIEGIVSKKDDASVAPPENLPANIEAAFREAATCQAVACYNAAATMYRLCVDLATKELLPKAEVPNLNSKTRRDLGLRLPWLFGNNILPDALHELSSCIKEDGNDGAHAGTLTKMEAEDLLDFTSALLTRLYTEPEQLRLATLRRATRREEAKKNG